MSMDALTEAELKQFAPSAKRDYVLALVNGWGDVQRQNLDAPARLCEWLGQHAHETGGFTIIRENTSWTGDQMKRLWPSRFPLGAADPRIIAAGRDPRKLANLAYSNRSGLGNKGGDDGWDYRGGSFCQLTGRAAYREAGEALGLPLEEQPELIERPEVGLKVALWYWNKRGCNAFADRGYTRAIGNAINRGNPYSSMEPIGAVDRQRWRDRAVTLFGDGDKIHKDGLALGAYGSQVEVLQRRLKELNYGVGASDQVFGPATARAVAAFKLDHKRRTSEEMEPDEIVGSKTWHQLNAGEPVVYVNREDATVKDLEGSETVAAAQSGSAAGTLIVAGSAAKGVQDSGMLDGMQTTLGWLPGWHSFLLPVIDAMSWGLKNAWWVLTLVGGVWFWTRGRQIIKARLKDHKLGFNLFR